MSEFRVDFPGPFSHHEVVVDGWKVPLIHAHPTGANDDKIMLVLDNRLADTFTVEEAERFVPFLADAIAIALGYTCHPRGDEEPNHNPQPRPVRMHGIAGIQTEEPRPMPRSSMHDEHGSHVSREPVTADEFERAYAERSGTTVERLRVLGRVVVRCRCGEDECEGWASVSREAAKDYKPGGIYGP